MSIRWIRSVLVDEEETALEIQIGYRRMGDRCYTRIGQGLEEYFHSQSEDRGELVHQGIDILQRKLANKSVTYPDGRLYDWK